MRVASYPQFAVILLLFLFLPSLYCISLQVPNTTFYYFGDPQIGFGLDGIEKDIFRFQTGVTSALMAKAWRLFIAGDLVNAWNDDTQLQGFKAVWVEVANMTFLVPGNHDVSNMRELLHFRDNFGKDYQYIVNLDAAFLCLNSEVLISSLAE